MLYNLRPIAAPTLTNLTATPGIGQTQLHWDLPADATYKASQVWTSLTNDTNTASLLATVANNAYTHQSGDTSQRFYWVKAVNTYNRADGAWSNAVQGNGRLITGTDISPGAVDLAKHVTGMLSTGNITGLGALAILDRLGVAKIDGLGQLATADKVNVATQLSGALDGRTQVTNLGNLAYADTIAANVIGAGILAAGVEYVGNIYADQVVSGIFTGLTFRTAASGQRVEISASGNSLNFYDAGGNSLASIGYGGAIVCSAGASFPGLFVSSSSSWNTAAIISGDLQLSGRLNLGSNNAYTCGDANSAWAGIYSVTALNVTSDTRAKEDIQDTDLGLDFVLKLRPVSYRLKVGHVEVQPDPDAVGPHQPGRAPTVEVPHTGTRRHYGLLAQEVKAALGDADAAFWCLADKNDPESAQSLRYEELVPVLIRAVQQLSERVVTLEAVVRAKGA